MTCVRHLRRQSLVPVAAYGGEWSRPPADGQPSDELLLVGYCLGDPAAATAFVRRFQRRVFGMALQMVSDSALAEDVAQEAFTRAYRHGQVFDARRGSVATWLLAITRNLAIDALRMRRSDPMDPSVLAGLVPPSTRTEPERHAERADDAVRLRHALAAIPPDQARAVLLATFGGRTAREISETEGIPLGTAKTRVRDGLLKLRAHWTGEDVAR
jgi:RNA polymerase sigma factor (sigma-70 family)